MEFQTLELISNIVVTLYSVCLVALMLYGVHRYRIIYLFWKHHKRQPALPAPVLAIENLPPVTVQLPIFNEKYVVERLINAVAAFDYPAHLLEIQVLDDSTDETVELTAGIIEAYRAKGIDIQHIRRPHRKGYKAGALAYGLERAKGDFVAIFDADFLPPADFLKATVPYFNDSNVGLVQTRWGHLNAGYSLLTRLQSIFLDGHFVLEHTARYKSGAFFNFNGTAGIWRKEAIDSAGGWSPRTITEDLDLSYRAQLKGWKFVYLPDFVCPAELPIDIHAFYSQQRRWTKGAIQVMRHMLKDLWVSAQPLHIKLESTVHLTANLAYILSVLVSILILPSLCMRHLTDWGGIAYLEVAAFFITTLSVVFFYGLCQKELYTDWKWRMRDIFALMSFGIGMGLTNAIAVLDGLFGDDRVFVRTPKFDVTGKVKSRKKNIYAFRLRKTWIAPMAFALYSLITFFVAVAFKDWVAMPFIGLFVFGFLYVAGLNLSRPPQLD